MWQISAYQNGYNSLRMARRREPPVEPEIDSEIESVIREDRSRGLKKPFNSAARDAAKARRRQEREFLDQLLSGPDDMLGSALKARGLKPGSPAYEEALRNLHEARRLRGLR